MQDPTPLKQAGEDVSTDLRILMRMYLDALCVVMAYHQLGIDQPKEAVLRSSDFALKISRALGIDLMERVDFHTTRIQEGG